MHEARRIAEQAALAAGRLIAERAGMTGLVRSKSTGTDLVTETDVQAGVLAALAILAADPGARFVIEEAEVFDLTEAVEGGLDAPAVWVIDPLDGTTSYVHGFPCFSVSIAYLNHGVPMAGAVYNVPLDQMASAHAGGGATVNGIPIQCTETDALAEALLITGFPYDRGALLDRQLAALARFLRAPVHGIRRDGSAAIDLVHVAMGRADGFWEFGLKPWDMAAGVLLCQEAGAAVSDISGAAWTPAATGVVAANPALHALMLDVIHADQ
ncbi:MAG: inositol monophosphatase [Actinobacteria bacterium]|nr:inositol monophosphatase [Actinomycetota bacterium]MCG2808333.1 inositol monophosphatase [Coriobacteriia bacterium]